MNENRGQLRKDYKKHSKALVNHFIGGRGVEKRNGVGLCYYFCL